MRTVFRNEEIPGRIAELRPFLSAGKLPDGPRCWSGYRGLAVLMGHLPRQYQASARQAVYVVYSYDTPIAWVTELEVRTPHCAYRYHLPDVGYSPTTGQHQWAVMEAWGPQLRAQGTYGRLGARGRETVTVPGNAEAYGRTRRARSGGVDGVRPGEVIGSRRIARLTRGDEDDESCMGPLGSSWTGHRAHP